MNVACYLPYATWTPHFETDLELIEMYLEQGDSVTALVCNAALAACDINPDHTHHDCVNCRRTRDVGFARLSQRIPVYPLGLKSRQWKKHNAVVDQAAAIKDVDELKRWTIENFDIGYAVLSSLVSIQREPAPCLDQHRSLVTRLASAAWTGYASGRRFLQQRDVDLVCLFNGRHVGHRGMVRACQAHGVPFVTHDRGHDSEHYEVYQGVSPHDIQYVDKCVNEAWAAGDKETREETGAEWYRERIRGIDRRFKSYVSDQESGQLPDDWNPARHNVAIFVSSEDEFVAIGDQWSGPLYSSQLEGLRRILASLKAAGDSVRLYLRVHPNLIGLENTQTRGLRQLDSPQLVTIPADSSICTYTLMRAADTTLSFGSTAGIEATYWGRPSILAGMSFYRQLGGTYNPASHEELVDLLTSRPAPLPPEAALRYGYYMSTYGKPYRYFEPESLFVGKFKGRRLDLTWRYRLEFKLARWWDRHFGRRAG